MSVFCLRSSLLGLVWAGGCVSDKVPYEAPLIAYQQGLAAQGPQQRLSDANEESAEPRGLLIPAEREGLASRLELNTTADPNTGQKTISLTLDQAIAASLANSPEIRVVSFDPEIARQEITKAAGEFDPVQFEEVSWNKQDSPQNSYFEPGEADKRLFESGVRQKTPLGSEWSASYALAHNWDDLSYRPIPTRYEPMLIFQLKQSLLRDAWGTVNLAGVNTARLGYQIALIGFRDKAESVSADVIAAYWRLVQVRRNLEIQQELVTQTLATLHKVDGRREIDATDVQLMQARAYAKLREADLLESKKQVKDVQDGLTRFMADSQVNVASDVTIVPVTAPPAGPESAEPSAAAEDVPTSPVAFGDPDRALAAAMTYNPAVVEARIRVKIAEINIQVAQNQQMPRVDLVGSARAQGLAKHDSDAHDQLWDQQYVSYSMGLSIEIPLGNRARQAELTRRRLEQHRAVSVLHSAADQVAVQVKERARKARTTLQQIGVQREAAHAAQAQLKALEESEPIREKLTPEFLLVKLQAQETYAQARRAETSALIEFNIAVAELARTTGTVLKMHRVDDALTQVTQGCEP